MSRRTGKRKNRSGRRCALEVLESRQLLAVTAVGDHYEVQSDSTLEVNTLLTSYVGGRLEEASSIVASGTVLQIEYSPQYQILIVRDSNNLIQVFDAQTQTLISQRTASTKFSDMDLTPDGRYLFATDDGAIAYDQQIAPTYIFRLDLATRTWESKLSPAVARRLEAVDGQHVLAQERNQWIDVMLYDFGADALTPMTEVDRTWADYSGDIEYDFRTKRLYHGSTGSSVSVVTVLEVMGNNLVSRGTNRLTTATMYGEVSTLSSDGRRFYYGKTQLEAADPGNSLRVFPEAIWAATPYLAFGASGYYSAQTGELLGNLGFASQVYYVSDDGLDVWAFESAGRVLHHYRITGTQAGVLLNDSGSGPLTTNLATSPAHGQLDFRSDGSFTYTPSGTFVGVDSFSYVTHDALGEEATAVVSIAVQPGQGLPTAVNDNYTTVAGTPLVVDRSTSYDFPELVEVAQFQAPGNVSKLVFAPDSHLLLLMTGTAVRIIDVRFQIEVQSHAANNTFSDMDLTPDGRYLYVADDGGTRIGAGTPARPHYVHRLDLQTLTWETKVAPAVAYKIEAVDSQRFLLQEQDQHVDMMLNDFGATATAPIVELSRIRADYNGDFEYDAQTGRIYHGSSGSTSREIHVRAIVGNTLVDRGDTGIYGTATSGGGTTVLSSDGTRLYYGALQVSAQNVTTNTNYFPELIYAASSLVAFGKLAYYDARTSEARGTWGFDASIINVSAAGDDVWVFNPADDMLHHYRLAPVTRLGLLVNDRHPSGDALAADLVTPAAHGNVALNADGTFTYVPEACFVGTDVFRYVTIDSAGNQSQAQVTIEVQAAPVTNIAPQPVNDEYRTFVGQPLNIGVQPWRDVPAQETLSFATSLGVKQLQHSPQFNAVIVRSGTNIVIYDAATGTMIDTHAPHNVFTDMDLTADGRYLFAADFGGELVGYGDPLLPHYVHRYDLATRTWDVQYLTNIAYRLEAIDRNHVLLMEQDQWVDVTYNYFSDWPNAPMEERSRIAASDSNDFEYDPRTQRLYFGDSPLFTRRLVAGALVVDMNASTAASGGGGGSVLSSDGQRFYFGRLQVEAADVRNNLRTFPEAIMAATGEVAFGKSSYYDAKTGAFLGTLGFEATAWYISDDSAHAWAADKAGVLHHYDLHAGAQGLLANDLDANGDPLQVTAVAQPANGSVTYDASGAFRYTPKPGFMGTDQFTYRVTDPSGANAFATVRINVAQRFAPTAIELTDNRVYERVRGIEVGRITVADPDPGDTHTFVLSDDRFEIVAGELRLKSDVGVDASAESTISLLITATGSDGQSLTKTFALTVVANAQPWLNPTVPMDVSNDGDITPLDAVLIVNELNSAGPRLLASLAGGASISYLDPSGDGELTPLDALVVINFLNAGGHAEQTPQLVDATPLIAERREQLDDAADEEPSSAADVALAWYWYESQTAVGKQAVDSADSATDDLIEALLSIADQTH